MVTSVHCFIFVVVTEVEAAAVRARQQADADAVAEAQRRAAEADAEAQRRFAEEAAEKRRVEEQAAAEAARVAFDAMTPERQQEMIMSFIPRAFDNDLDAQEKLAEHAYATIEQALFTKIPPDILDKLIQENAPDLMFTIDEDELVNTINNDTRGGRVLIKFRNVLKKLKPEWLKMDEAIHDEESEQDQQSEVSGSEVHDQAEDEEQAEDDDQAEGDDHSLDHAVTSAAGNRPSPTSVALDMEAEAGGMNSKRGLDEDVVHQGGASSSNKRAREVEEFQRKVHTARENIVDEE